MKTVKVRAPTRLDLGGGWTDVPPYCENEGGFVCNVAINRYATATIRANGVSSEPLGVDAPLVKAALKRTGLAGVRCSIESDFPVGAGLGGSSAASAALLGALAAWRDEPWDPREIAEAGRRIEVEDLGVPGGRQDHYASTHGGVLALTFSSAVDVRRVELSADTRAEFERRALLVYSGESRISGGNITEVLRAYDRRDARVVLSLSRMRRLAEEICTSLEDGNLDGVGALMGEHWSHQRTLHPAIPTPLIEHIVSVAHARGAIGSKAMGASGGGCVLVMCGEQSVENVHAAIAPLGTLIPFQLDTQGLARIG